MIDKLGELAKDFLRPVTDNAVLVHPPECVVPDWATRVVFVFVSIIIRRKDREGIEQGLLNRGEGSCADVERVKGRRGR